MTAMLPPLAELSTETTTESGLTIVKFAVDLLTPIRRSTAEEQHPDQVVGSLIGSGDGMPVESLYSAHRVEVDILCREGHRVCGVYSHTGGENASLVSWRLANGETLTERALWLAWRPGLSKVERHGIPPRALRLTHLCRTAQAVRQVRLALDLDRVRGDIEDMWEVGRVTTRRMSI